MQNTISKSRMYFYNPVFLPREEQMTTDIRSWYKTTKKRNKVAAFRILVKEIGISERSFFRKMRGETKLKIIEHKAIKYLLAA